MQKYILRRILISIPMIVGISLITFVMVNLAPGDPLTAMIPPDLMAEMSPAQLDAKKRQLGLDRPMMVRYFIWLGELVRGNFGFSFLSREPVLKIIWERIPPTLELTFAALVIGTLGGFVMGVIAALKQYSLYDYALSFASLVGLSIPGFFLALIALFLFVLRFEWFPSHGMTSELGRFNIWDNLYHLVLPASVLAIELLAVSTRYARTAMLEVLHSDYVTTARAKGLSEWVVIGRHAFRNALLPLITISSLRIPLLFGGVIVIEQMFSWPGMGLLTVRAITNVDYPVLMALTFWVAVIVLFSNLLADVLYAVADPRIRTD